MGGYPADPGPSNRGSRGEAASNMVSSASPRTRQGWTMNSLQDILAILAIYAIGFVLVGGCAWVAR